MPKAVTSCPPGGASMPQVAQAWQRGTARAWQSAARRRHDSTALCAHGSAAKVRAPAPVQS
eukprot:351852-Chlamydomonas_euryale.AAC.3